MIIAEYELPEAQRNVRDCDHAGRPSLYRYDIGTTWLGVLVCGALRAQWYSQADRRFTVCYYALEAPE